MARVSPSYPNIPNVMEEMSGVFGNQVIFQNSSDFGVSKQTQVNAPLYVARGLDIKHPREVSIVINRFKARKVLKELMDEMKFVLKLEHPNLMKFYGNTFYHPKGNLGFIYEAHRYILSEVLAEHIETVYRPEVIKYIMREIFMALDYLHKNGVVHRDIQTENIVITWSGAVKVWNFRCAQAVGESLEEIETLHFHYQPVESLMSEGVAHPSLDIWSAIVIFGELWLKETVFPAFLDVEILTSIFSLLSFPTEESWEDFFSFRLIERLKKDYSHHNMETLELKFAYLLFEPMTQNAWDLLENCLVLNPQKRLTAEQCLAHPYFSEGPIACGSDVLTTIVRLTDVAILIRQFKSQLNVSPPVVYP